MEPSRAGGAECDEIVGRFCLLFDAGHDPLPKEPEGVAIARHRAIEKLMRAAEVAPARAEFVFPLVRYLTVSERTAEALQVARAYASNTADSASGHMVLGFALHHDRQTEAAALEFARWLEKVPQREREKVEDVDWLISPAARKRLSRLAPPKKAEVLATAWRYADPLLITPGNELWTDHMARHAAARMLRGAPVVSGWSWGGDVEQLTVRFGETVLTTRSLRSGSIGMNQSFSDHWNPDERTYFPPEPDSIARIQAGLDTIWPIDPMVTRSGHAPPTIRTMRVLEHQVAVLGPAADLVRFVGVVPTDSLTQKPLRAMVFLLDSAFNEVARAEARTCTSCIPTDSAMLIAEIHLHPNARYYSAEIYDPASRFAARARHALARPTGSVSDILLTQAFPAGQLPESSESDRVRPLSRPVIRSGDRFGLYAEITNEEEERRSANVTLEVRSIAQPSAVQRMAGWIGEKLGITTPRSPTRLTWTVELEAKRSTAIPITLDLGPLTAGNYRITVSVDHAAGLLGKVSRDFAVVTAR